MIKARHTTDNCVVNNQAYREISLEEIFKKFQDNKFTFFNSNRITFKPIGFVNNDYLQVIVDNDNDKRLLNQLNIINTKKIINELEYEIAMSLKEIEINSHIDINHYHNVSINGITVQYSIKELIFELIFNENTDLPTLKDKNIINDINQIVIDDTLQHQLLYIRYNHKEFFKLAHSNNLLKCYKNRLDNLVYGGL